jgi:hypothetical protein
MVVWKIIEIDKPYLFRLLEHPAWIIYSSPQPSLTTSHFQYNNLVAQWISLNAAITSSISFFMLVLLDLLYVLKIH